MTRLTLRKGFSLQPVPGGPGHLVDARTGDALVVPVADYEVLAAGGEAGLDSSQPSVAEVLERYRPFYVEVVQPASFYELDIEDAPTVVEIPQIAPVTLPHGVAAAVSDEPVTKEESPFERPDELTQPGPSPASVPQEENLREALETHRTEQVSTEEVAALLGSPPPTAPAPPEELAPPARSKRPLVLAFGGIALLVLGVVATFALRPGGEPVVPDGPTLINTAVVDASTPEPLIDAGSPEVLDAGGEEQIDAGPSAPVVAVIAPEPIDAGLDEPFDAGAEDDTEWLTAEVQARGRVKMGEVLAAAEGEVSWSVEEGQRVKSKEPLGVLTRKSGGEAKLIAPSVGLAMLKQPNGAAVKKAVVLAEIIYFEAWAKGLVRGKAPKPTWRCEVVSASAQQNAECKISVVTPKAGGAQVTVAIEPRWFDEATDAVLRFAPP